jgi:hypothetical protein
MNLDEREAALLKLVEDERERACRALLHDAAQRAQAIRQQAYRRERAALHQRIVAERARADELVRAAAAERATAERRLDEQTDAQLLAAAWPPLRSRLHERWRQGATRRLWVLRALEQARHRLPPPAWSIRYAPGWTAAEQQAVLSALGATSLTKPEPEFGQEPDSALGLESELKIDPEPELGPKPEAGRALRLELKLSLDEGLSAGLVVTAEQAVLDMSLEGMLRDRAWIEARLLALAKRKRTGSAR